MESPAHLAQFFSVFVWIFGLHCFPSDFSSFDFDLDFIQSSPSLFTLTAQKIVIGFELKHILLINLNNNKSSSRRRTIIIIIKPIVSSKIFTVGIDFVYMVWWLLLSSFALKTCYYIECWISEHESSTQKMMIFEFISPSLEDSLLWFDLIFFSCEISREGGIGRIRDRSKSMYFGLMMLLLYGVLSKTLTHKKRELLQGQYILFTAHSDLFNIFNDALMVLHRE